MYAELYTPYTAECSVALVSFGLADFTGIEIRDALCQRWSIVIKALPHGREGLRASMAFFLLEEENDALLSALKTLVEEK
ncbi:MAG: hypothetical protein ACKVJG_16185 [Candidatus Latescibacterota bacterium]